MREDWIWDDIDRLPNPTRDAVLGRYPDAYLQSKPNAGGMYRVVVPSETGGRSPVIAVGGWSTSEPGAWASALRRIEAGRTL